MVTVLKLTFLDEKWAGRIAQTVIARHTLRRLAVILTASLISKVAKKLLVVRVEILVNLRPIGLPYKKHAIRTINISHKIGRNPSITILQIEHDNTMAICRTILGLENKLNLRIC